MIASNLSHHLTSDRKIEEIRPTDKPQLSLNTVVSSHAQLTFGNSRQDDDDNFIKTVTDRTLGMDADGSRMLHAVGNGGLR
eukprot:scaffold300058_cov49-Prasinocladus_malaysianus.AAC.1